jgi:hypothetical protein
MWAGSARTRNQQNWEGRLSIPEQWLRIGPYLAQARGVFYCSRIHPPIRSRQPVCPALNEQEPPRHTARCAAMPAGQAREADPSGPMGAVSLHP